jgi:PPOX class probable F420-dependent enzyme
LTADVFSGWLPLHRTKEGALETEARSGGERCGRHERSRKARQRTTMSRRNLIQLTPDERRQFLEERKTIILSTIDHRGYPHAVPMWYVVQDGAVFMTTYAKSQKVANIDRNPRVALLVESGVTYETLKGVLIRGHAEVVRDVEACTRVLTRVHEKMTGSLQPGIDEAMKAQARKRVVIKVTPERVSSWDHRKLGGVY